MIRPDQVQAKMRVALDAACGRNPETCPLLAKLDRLTRSVKDLCELLERFERRGVALVSVAESLDTGSAAGRLVLNIMAAVSQWEREAIGERTRDAMRHKRRASVWANIAFGSRLSNDGQHLEPKSARVGGVGGNPTAAQPTHDLARYRRCPQPTGLPNQAGYAVAAGVSGAGPQTGAGVIRRLMCFWSWRSFCSQNPQRTDLRNHTCVRV